MSELIISINPINKQIVGKVSITQPKTVDDILQKSATAQTEWGKLRVSERSKILTKARRILVKKSEEIIRLISDETGKPYWDSFMEVMTVAEHLKYVCKEAPFILSKEHRSSSIFLHKKSYVQYVPYGTVGVISPWNYPLILTMSPVIEALISGNSVVLKPSEYTPIIAETIKKIFLESGVPNNVFQIVHGYGDIGNMLVNSKKTNLICFTGSVKVGQIVAKSCAQQLKPVVLELGGKDPMIVMDDANIDRAVSAAIWGGFSNCGQTCISVERVYVIDSIADKFIGLLKKQILDIRVSDDKENSDLGTIINQKQKDLIGKFVDQAKKDGLSIYQKSDNSLESDSFFYLPTVIETNEKTSSLMQSEIFGPVITITRVSNEKEAINAANSTDFGLSASVFSKNIYKARKIAKQINSGSVCINDVNTNYICSALPFGGVGISGIGRVHGPEGIKTFSKTQSICEDKTGFKKELWWFPVGEKTKKWFKIFFRYWYS